MEETKTTGRLISFWKNEVSDYRIGMVVWTMTVGGGIIGSRECIFKNQKASCSQILKMCLFSPQ